MTSDQLRDAIAEAALPYLAHPDDREMAWPTAQSLARTLLALVERVQWNDGMNRDELADLLTERCALLHDEAIAIVAVLDELAQTRKSYAYFVEGHLQQVDRLRDGTPHPLVDGLRDPKERQT
jgi:hypothetical protein